MKTKILAIITISALAFAACENNDKNQNGQANEIKLSTGIIKQTKAAFTEMDTQFPDGEQVAVWVYDVDGAEKYANNVLTTDGAGALEGGTTMYFPKDNKNLNIFGFHTNAALTATWPTTVTHAVNADQTTLENYLGSDLLYAIRSNVAQTEDPVTVTFYHMLSKIQVAIKSGDGEPDLSGATLKVLGLSLKADFAPSKTADMTAQAERAAMITLTAADNGAAEITLGNDLTTGEFPGEAVYNDAVIVPQTIVAGSFIQLTLADDTVLTYELPADATFESGKKYIYRITVNNEELEITTSIEDWEAGNGAGEDGSAEME